MQLLCNSSLDLLRSHPFFNLSGGTLPLRECTHCARWNWILQGRIPGKPSIELMKGWLTTGLQPNQSLFCPRGKFQQYKMMQGWVEGLRPWMHPENDQLSLAHDNNTKVVRCVRAHQRACCVEWQASLMKWKQSFGATALKEKDSNVSMHSLIKSRINSRGVFWPKPGSWTRQ